MKAPHAFECLNDECPGSHERPDVPYEWRMNPQSVALNSRGLGGYVWPTNVCPRCGHPHIEWLSSSTYPEDVYLSREFRYWEGTLKIKKL